MESDLKTRGDARLEAALATAGVQDPRTACRARLRWLKEADRSGFDQAVDYYERVLVPAAGADTTDPISAWQAFARRLAELSGPGRIVDVDESGLAAPATGDTPLRGLALHIPEAERTPVLILRCPSEPTAAQQATIELLVEGRLQLQGRV